MLTNIHLNKLGFRKTNPQVIGLTILQFTDDRATVGIAKYHNKYLFFNNTSP